MVATVSAEGLADKIDRGEEFNLLDTRPAESYSSWHIPGAVNVPYSPDETLEPESVADMAVGEEVLLICAEGISSLSVAEELEALGYTDVTVVEGGMAAWSEVYETVSIPTTDDRVEIVQVQRRAKGCLGYVIGSSTTDAAAAIDVTRHSETFRHVAASKGYELVRVFDTHIHADHLSGGRNLATDLDIPYHLGEAAATRNVQYDYAPIGRNDVVAVGDIDFKAIPTPGHTSDIVSYLVNAEAVLTGDTLFVESVGRTELQFGNTGADEGARLLYDSLHHRLLNLPDSVLVLPGHVTVTDEGEWQPGRPGDQTCSSIGELRTGLELLQLDEEAFVRRITESVPEKPPNFEEIIAINRGTEPVTSDKRATELELGPNRCAAP